MKLIILAAGKGERLLPLTRNTPKPLLDMGNGCTLLEEQIQNVEASGVIDEVVLVIGYLAEQVEAKLKHYQSRGFKLRTIFNPFYEVSNNLMSLWLARQVFAEDDAMITNGDNIFSAEVFRGFARDNGEGIFLAVCDKTSFDDDDMKVTIADGAIARVSKKIPAVEAQAESPGLSMVRGRRARSLFLDNLEVLARNRETIGRFWLETFNSLYDRGVSIRPWKFVSENNWQEVDFHVDLAKARELLGRIASRVPRSKSMPPQGAR